MNKIEEQVIIQCQKNNGERQKKIKKFSNYFDTESQLTSNEKKYYYIIFSIFHEFITPRNDHQFQVECIPKMKKDIYRLLRKHFRIKLTNDEIYTIHNEFIDFFNELFELSYSDFKDFRGFYLEIVIERISNQINFHTWSITNDKVHKYIEPTFFRKTSEKGKLTELSKLNNDIDIGFVYKDIEISPLKYIHLIECKSSLNTFAKNIVFEILKEIPQQIPEISKIHYMRDISEKLASFGYAVNLTMATYDPLISIKYIGFKQENCKYPINYMKDNVKVIDFNKLIFYLNVG